MSAALLGGIVVLEWAEGVAAPSCGKLLSDQGATVLKIERPGLGDPLRQPTSAVNNGTDSSSTGMFLHVNTGKQSIALDPLTADGREVFLRLFRECDVLVHDKTAEELYRARFDVEYLRTENPNAVITSVTPFGYDGPYASFASSKLVLYHLGGLAYGTPGAVEGPENHPPLESAGFDAEMLGGLCGAVGTMASLYGRANGLGTNVVDASCFEALASFSRLNFGHFFYAGEVTSRLTGAINPVHPGFLPCADGWLNVYAADDHLWRRFVELMDSPDWAASEIFDTRESRGTYWDAIEVLVAEWSSGYARDDLYRLMQEARIPSFPYYTMDEVVRDPQLLARGYFQTVDHADHGPILHPGPLFQSSAGAVHLKPAPRLDEHKDRQTLNRSSTTRAQDPPEPAQWLPLAGVRVLDLTWVIAGPSAAQLLAQLGADVIKIESRARLDQSRRTGPYADRVAGIERSGYYHGLNAGKRSVALDLSTTEGRALLYELIGRSDVFLEGLSAHAVRGLGLDYDELIKANPDLIYVSISGLGRSGPCREYVAYGPQLMSIAGWDSLVGYPDEPPKRGGGQYLDQYTGLSVALATLLALHHRHETGQGQSIDVSMLECMISVIPNAAIEYGLTGKIPPPRANFDPASAPYGAYPCLGEDRWVAISVGTDAEWHGLARATGHPEWASDPRFNSAAARVAHRAEVDELVSAWTRLHEPRDVMLRLQTEGVPAGMTSTVSDLAHDPHLRARGLFAARAHPVVGARDLPDVPFRIDGLRARNCQPAPLLGQHTEAVLAEVLGLSSEQLECLKTAGVLQ
jgi:crotonobetainyl-CoA:carnitine CoA-transferase CaiB-like acyl-CoA transferase